MQRHLTLISTFLACLAAIAGAQETAKPSESATSTPIRVQSRLVVVDVIVRDKNKHAVHGLTAADFSLTESDQPQQIKLFEEHKADHNITPIAMPVLPPGTFTNYTPVALNAATTVLLLDSLNTPLTSQNFVISQLREYLKHADPQARIAIFGLSTKLTMLQGFTSDPAVLRAVVEKHLDTKISPLLDDPVGEGTGFASPSDILSGTGSASDFTSAIAGMKQFESYAGAVQSQIRLAETIEAFDVLGRYLSAIPGRKNLIWFSGSFPLSIVPDAGITNPMLVVAGMEEEFRDTSILLANARVAVYPVDARGLQTAPSETASTKNLSTVASLNENRFGGVGEMDRNFEAGNAQEHLTMSAIAHDTGGSALYNDNGLSAAIGNIIANGSDFYTLSYAPSNTTNKPDFRPIAVTVAAKNVELSYRRGYFTDQPKAAPAESKQNIVTSAKSAPTVPISFTRRAALMHGAPTPTEILIKVQIVPASTATETAVADGNSPDSSRPPSGPFRRYIVNFSASPRAVRFTRLSKDTIHTSLEYSTLCYDEDGRLVNAAGNTVNQNYTPLELQQMLHVGLNFQQDISVPAKGGHFLRFIVHDLISNRYGVVEVPVVGLRGLKPATTSLQALPSTPVVASTPAP